MMSKSTHATLVLYTCTNDNFYVRIRRTIPRQRRQREERELLELEEAANASQAQADHEAETLAALENAARYQGFVPVSVPALKYPKNRVGTGCGYTQWVPTRRFCGVGRYPYPPTRHVYL